MAHPIPLADAKDASTVLLSFSLARDHRVLATIRKVSPRTLDQTHEKSSATAAKLRQPF
jgi:hypothetical protein